MRICWDTLDGLTYDVARGMWVGLYSYKRAGRKSLQTSKIYYKYVEECSWCREPFLSYINNVGNFCCKSCGISYKQTGQPSGMSGKKHSIESRSKISISNTGKVRTDKMREKYSLSKMAENSPWYGITGPKHPRYGLSWLKGSKEKEENLKKMWAGLRERQKSRGLPYNDNELEHPFKGVKRPDFSGKNNPNWLGGITSNNESIRKSIEYNEWRTSVFKRDNFTCRQCGAFGVKLVAHHVVPLNILLRDSLDGLLFEIGNGITMCDVCHKKHHSINGYKSNTNTQ